MRCGVVLLLGVVTGVFGCDCYPSCDPCIISEIQTFWSGLYTSDYDEILKTLETDGTYVAKFLTDEPFLNTCKGNPKCVYADFTCNSVTYSFLPEDGCYGDKDLETVTYEISEDCGIISVGTVKHYVVYLKNGILACYSCDTASQNTGSPHGSIFVKQSVFDEHCTHSTKNVAHGLLNLLGIEFPDSYSNDCACTCS